MIASILNALATTPPPVKPSPIAKALSTQYPTLASTIPSVNFVASPPDTSGRKLEFYAAKESTNPSPGRPTVQTFGTQKPADVAGDLVSHYLARGADPTLTRYYNQFTSSLTPQQHQTLRGQYAWAQKNQGENRPYEMWAVATGIPAYFRGYTFGQWPQSFTQSAYTPQQKTGLNNVIRYLQGPSAYGSGK